MLNVVGHILVSSIPWEQILPLLFVFVLAPLLALGTYRKAGSTLPWLVAMLFENLGIGVAWSWLYNHDAPPSTRGKKSSRKKHLRRADQVAARPDSIHENEGYYPGLVNISGTYCFLNSTLQAMASVSYLHPYINAVHSRAEQLDVPTPVIDALRDALNALNTPTTSPRAIRPIAIISALSVPVPGKQRSALFSSREHQDAQELFQLLSECVKNESKAVDDELSRDRGLGELSRAPSEEPEYAGTAAVREKDAGKGVFDGLTANRRSCVECGYTEAVMHFAFDNWQLAVPRMASCGLEDCLTDYTRLELLNDCICRKCSMLATYKRLVSEAEKATEAVSADHEASSSKKKRAREARKLEARVKAALDEGRIEEDIKGVKMEKVYSRCSTKQAMIARPPQVLALHLNRSIHYGTSGIKNTCRILFPEHLDLTPFTTSGQLSTSPSAPISSPSCTPPPRSNTPTPATYTPRVLYRLSAVVCHFGAHSFGHYVAYRRKPRPLASGKSRFEPPTLRCPLGCECETCAVLGPIRDANVSSASAGAGTGDQANGEIPAYAASRWLRISDDSVEEVGIERVLAETAGTFMLYYERVVQPRPTVAQWEVQTSPRSSEETITPANVGVGVHEASVGMGLGVGKVVVDSGMARAQLGGARVVRSVYAGRSRSRSPSVRNVSPASSVFESVSSLASTSSSSVREASEPATPKGETPASAAASVSMLHPMSIPPASNGNGDAACVAMSQDEEEQEVPSIADSSPQGVVKPVSPSRSPQRTHLRVPASSQATHTPRPLSPARTVGLRA